MNRVISVDGWDISNLSSCEFDLAVGFIGYEKRSRYFFQNHHVSALRKIANYFENRQVLSFDDNKNFYSAAGFEQFGGADLEFRKRFSKEIALAGESKSSVKICVDISSVNRSKLAAILETVFMHRGNANSLELVFAYSTAKYKKPKTNEWFIEWARPVSKLFSGWSANPEKPTCLIFGVGYEQDKVIGAIEYLEPAKVMAYVPIGRDPRFLDSVVEMNESLWPTLQENSRINYLLHEPANTYSRLEAMCYSLLESYRPVLVPFGPKLFALNSMLVSMVHFPSLSVWRVSSGQTEDPIQREADGPPVFLKLNVQVTNR